MGDWGLCRPAYEKDSCGFGLIASLDDQASHWVLQTAISSLNRLTHRGAIAADGKTGDGCGLLIKQPTAFLRAVAAGVRVQLWRRCLPPAWCFSIGIRPGRARARGPHRATANREAAGRRLSCLAGRPPRPAARRRSRPCPSSSRCSSMRGGDLDEATFNRKLYLARRRTEKQAGSRRPGLLHPVAVGQHHRLQGHGDAAVPGPVLSRPEGSADGSVGGGVPSALFHQHPAAVAPGASLSLSGPQRRDQHRAGQPQLGGGARPLVPFAGAAGSERHSARSCP